VKVIALVDGEHYPSVTRWGLEAAAAGGLEPVLALVVGGIEKLGADRRLDLGAIPVRHAATDARAALAEEIDRHRPGGVLDLSDEPVLGYERRMELVAVALAARVPYLGPDFRIDPPITEPALPAPTIAVIGVGKRVAKTAVSAHAARAVSATGKHPVIVAMGRGGPVEPEIANPADITLEALLARADRGEHAASDYLEDALMAGVPAIGARRCGGGLAGRPFVTNVAAAATLAVSIGGDPVILEGSGASVPPIPWDAGILVVPAGLPVDHLAGYLGPYRLLLSDLVVFIIGTGPSAGPENLSALDSHARRLRADIKVVLGELQPVPVADVRGKDAFFATTAQHEAARRIAATLERTAGCRVLSFSPNLADRAALERDLAEAGPFDVLLTELKGAAIDVAARRALDRGAEVAFVDNRPVTVGGDGDLDDLLRGAAALADERADRRTALSVAENDAEVAPR
jgi:cyclic 2,3-diphosphoglycerate synthetase